MKSLKLEDVEDVSVSSSEPDVNYSKENYIICGKNKTQEVNILVKFNLDKIEELWETPDNVQRVQLCLYFVEAKMESYMDIFMLNIAKNIDDFDIGSVNYKTAPKYYQFPCIYKINPENKLNYINFDITHIVRKWLDDFEDNYGLTITAACDGGSIFFCKSVKQFRAYIKVDYNDNSSTIENNSKCISCGQFINDTGLYKKVNNINIIEWNKGYNALNMNTECGCTGIRIEKTGMYQIDYSVNYKTTMRTCIVILLNGVEVCSSMVQAEPSAQMAHGYTLLNIKERDSLIQLAVRNSDLCLKSTGIAAVIRIVRIC